MRNKIQRLFYLFASLLTLSLLSQCAYHDTMQQRNTEGIRLQNELNSEVAKGNRLR